MERRLSILECLQPSERLLVLQDGTPVTAGEVDRRARELADAVRARGFRRLAIVADRTDTMIAALAACQAADCDVLLLRDAFPEGHAVWSEWQVEGVITRELVITREKLGQGPDRGGRVLLTTSGTTGQPKVAVHELDGLASRVVEANARPDPSARWLLTFHPASFAGMQVILTALITRAELVALTHPSISDLAAAAVAHRPTHVSGTPTFWRSLLMAIPAADKGLPVRQITIGGEAVDQVTLDQLRAAFAGARISQIYASTEAGALFAVRDGRAGFPAAWLESGIEGTRLRIREGVLEILSPRAMKGYLDDQARKNRTEDGWLISGDLVELAGDRVLFRGRTDDVINVGGAKVMPEEVENVLREHPDVREAKVYGQKNPLVGAIVCAEVVLAEGVKEDEARPRIFAHATQRLDTHKLPRLMKFVAAISTNAAGKKVRKA